MKAIASPYTDLYTVLSPHRANRSGRHAGRALSAAIQVLRHRASLALPFVTCLTENPIPDQSIWVTGAAGFAGRAILQRLRASGRRAIGLGHAPEGSPERADPLFLAGSIAPD
ncbi:NAD(P)-dependent oxidoreductase (plasmid) [Azospirillum brasilense]|uniref:NAD(P)-dependent oxidoreductase n=1 Tax=Azospirillum brasilense TaxID=192 RepID=A0A4D8R983_AZOBR|nr:NAD(P)-dependent oxidoreductase [Azospirillum brasilense]